MREKLQESKSRRQPAWYVYIVRCADASLYTGVTLDLERRIAMHNAGTASRYTRGRRPVRVVHCEQHPTRGAALRRELAIKALSRREKDALIRKALAVAAMVAGLRDIRQD